jgi:hypothetical protein
MRFLLALLLAAGCTQAPPAATIASPTPTAAAATASPTPTATPTVVPTTPSRPTAAPTSGAACPTLQGGERLGRAPLTMRAAGHPGYDRVVVDFGPEPISPFTVEQVPRVVQGGSGFPIEMQGSVFIQVHWPAAGGAGEYPGPRRLLPDTEVVREVVFEEFEGATTVGIGLSRLVCPTLSIQSGGRLVLDFDY